ncbi:MAG TPA: hypothetical protein VHK69_11910, partial [Chitinophagaceae bacterium]|nr:hypothetical protein [Chitinophagaceae bacterium]
MVPSNNRAVVVLAAFDYESLQLTLLALEHTLDASETVVVVLNGRKSYPAEKVERVARTWAAGHPATRFVVRPLCAGSEPWWALTEVLSQYGPLQGVEYICKIDDDVLPVRKGWLPRLAAAYEGLAPGRNLAFVTGLINNNSWGFNELVDLYGKRDEYAHQFNYTSIAGEYNERRAAPGVIDTGAGGTVWQYPYLAWWIHQWTSLKLPQFVERTAGLGLKEVPVETHYSIGCIYFRKSYWLGV